MDNWNNRIAGDYLLLPKQSRPKSVMFFVYNLYKISGRSTSSQAISDSNESASKPSTSNDTSENKKDQSNVFKVLFLIKN